MRIAPIVFLASVALLVHVARGQSVSALWKEHCVNCHRADGSGGGAGTQTLLTDELMNQDFDERFFKAIKEGVGESAMPGFAETLDDKQIWGLVVHTRELQARAKREKTGSPKANKEGVYASRHHPYTITTVLEGDLDTPWAVDFLPATAAHPTRFFITHRTGAVELVELDSAGKATRRIIANTPASRSVGQGMMEVALHPEFAQNGWVYLAFADGSKEASKGRANFTKVVRGKLKETPAGKFVWADEETIFEVRPEHYVNSGLHFGVRIVFKKEQLAGGLGEAWHMYFGIGERGDGAKAQDLTFPHGKIYRLLDDGSIPQDNPFAQSDEKQYKQIWSFGHRNPQGLVFALDGTLWDTEHGPRGGDELNKIEKGRNYGWPLISFGINYNDSPYRTPFQKPAEKDANESQRFVMPVYRWLPSIGACGLDVVKGEAFPQWKGDFVAGGLSGENVDRVRISDGKFVEREEILHGMGRVRDVVCGPDGCVYVVLNGPDMVVRIAPAK